MSMTYTTDREPGIFEETLPADRYNAATRRDDGDVAVPAYARGARASSGRKLKTWMILAPLGAVILVGAGAVMLTQGGEEAAPLAESIAAMPAPTQALPTPMAGVEGSAMAAGGPAAESPLPASTVAVAPTPAPAAAPVERQAAPVTRRAAPAAPAAATPRVEAAAEPTGPRPYVAEPAAGTTNLNTAPATPAPAPAATSTPAPAITPQPLG